MTPDKVQPTLVAFCCERKLGRNVGRKNIKVVSQVCSKREAAKAAAAAVAVTESAVATASLRSAPGTRLN